MPTPPFPHPPPPSCFHLPGFSCGPVKRSTTEQLTERLWTMIYVINILCSRSGRRIKKEKKNIQTILIESIPGNRSEEQDEFISAIRFPSAGKDIKVWFVFWLILRPLWTSLWEMVFRYGLIFSPLAGRSVVGNAVFRRNHMRYCWISNFVPYELCRVLCFGVQSPFLSVDEARDRSVCRLSVVGRGPLWNWL